MKITTLCCVFLLIAHGAGAQNIPGCSALGQTPASAFPVCTKDTFSQTKVPICTNYPVNVPGCGPNTGSYEDKNPFWYRFTCYQAGSLAFLITPNNLADDYDWQLYDITGVTNLNLVYTDASLFVVGNWSGSSGVTGASATGLNKVECGSDPAQNINRFSIMPVLQLGHTYLLLVSHYSDNQSGYKLSFGGGTAVITNPKLPDLQNAKPSCDAATITLKLNTKVKCNSLAADGSDFIISPALATVVAATGRGCSSSFDMDSITLVLNNPLPAGNYMLAIKKGADANTLLDDCDRDIPEGNKLPFTISSLLPTPVDSISPVACAPGQLQLVFKKNIRCNSVAADGSDFIVTGPMPVTVSKATVNCVDGVSGTIVLQLAAPVVKGGLYQIKLVQGSDGNSIVDECGQQTPAGAAASFNVNDTVSAEFSYQLFLGCRADTVVFAHDGRNGVNQWLWIFDAAGASGLQTKSVIFTTFGEKQISLKVSNGFCTDSITKIISLNNQLKAAFETNDLLCPEDAAVFKNNSTGDIISYTWDFGNGHTSILKNPLPELYNKNGIEKIYPVQLIVQNNAHCSDTAVSNIKVLKTCYIAVPNAFSPNGDGLNDYLYPLNAIKADNMDFNVYNRLGQRVYWSSDWTKKWDGTISGRAQSPGVYVWTLRYTHHDTGKKVFLKGTAVLIR